MTRSDMQADAVDGAWVFGSLGRRNDLPFGYRLVGMFVPITAIVLGRICRTERGGVTVTPLARSRLSSMVLGVLGVVFLGIGFSALMRVDDPVRGDAMSERVEVTHGL